MSSNSGGNDTHSFLYTGQHREEIPNDTTHIVVDSSVTEIGDRAFQWLRQLASIQLPFGLRGIGMSGLAGCISLRKIDIPLTVNSIGQYGFINCHSLVNVDLPEGLVLISQAAFFGCRGLKTISIPSTVIEIEPFAFRYCHKMACIDFPAGLQVIGEYAFGSCEALGHVIVPPSVNTIGDAAFSDCKILLSMELTEGLQHIGNYAFGGCVMLVNICIPQSVTNAVGDSVFRGCTRLEERFRNESLVDHVRSRFDKFPIHKICYYQAFLPTDTVLEKLRQILQSGNFSDDAMEDETFEMSPFHILAMSAKPNGALFQELAKSLPKQIFVSEDDSDKSPLHYLCRNPSPDAVALIKSVLQVTVLDRLNGLCLERWRNDIVNDLESINFDDMEERSEQIEEMNTKLISFEHKEVISLLEQALWKHKLDEAKAADKANHSLEEKGGVRVLKDVVSESDDNIHSFQVRQSCRIQCCADVVISNVLPFMW